MSDLNLTTPTIDPVAAVANYLQTQNRMYEDTDMHNQYILRLEKLFTLEDIMAYIEEFTMSAVRDAGLNKREIFKVFKSLVSSCAYGKSLQNMDMPQQNVFVQGMVKGPLQDANSSMRVFANDVQISMTQSLYVPMPMPTHMGGMKIVELAAMQLVSMFDYDWL
jgi:hypothetical protein